MRSGADTRHDVQLRRSSPPAHRSAVAGSLLVALVMVLGACPDPEPSPTESESLVLTVSPDRALVAGESVVLRATVSASATFVDAYLGFTLPPDVVSADPSPGWAPLAEGDTREAVASFTVPDDGWSRVVLVVARGVTGEGRLDAVERRIELDPTGRPRAIGADGEFRSDVSIELFADRRLSPGAEAQLTIRAVPSVSHPALSIALAPPPGTAVVSGTLERGPEDASAGVAYEHTVTVKLPAEATALPIEARARLGDPGPDDARVRLWTTP